MVPGKLWGLLAMGGVALGCAAPGTQVSDAMLARVPPTEMRAVQEKRMDTAMAKDQLARQKLETQASLNEMQLAKDDADLAGKKLKRAEQEVKTAEFARESRRLARAKSQVKAGRHDKEVADAKYKSAQALVDLTKSDETVASKRVDLANAKEDWTEYEAMKTSRDPSAKKLDGPKIKAQMVKAESSLNQETARRDGLKEQYTITQEQVAQLQNQGSPAQPGMGGAGMGGSNPAAPGTGE
jgi:hypothetical protein